MRGRKPSPERLKLLRAEVERVIGGCRPPVKPEWLTGDAAAEWDRIVGELTKVYLITPLDAQTLAAYCKAYAMWRQFDAIVEQEGPMTVDGMGNIKVHPAAKQCMQMFAELRRMAAEFGFSPAARSRIETPAQPSGDDQDFDNFTSDAV